MMKPISTIFLSLFFVALSQMSAAQQFVNPVPDSEFQARYKQVIARTTDESRYATFKVYMPGKYFSSQQVKQIASTFTNDFNRYQFVVDIYPYIYDKQNFYEVYDAFISFSAVMRLHDYINALPPQIPLEPAPLPTPTPTPQPVPTKPNITFPICSNYGGAKGCPLPLADNDFDYYAKGIFSQSNDGQRIQAAKDILSKSCLSMAQLMKIVLSFDLESNRLGFMKETFPAIYDLDNYNYATAVFTNDPYKNDWIGFAKSYLAPKPVPVPLPTTPVCEVKGQEFEDIKATIKKQSFSSTQMAMAQQILSAKKCFTTSQIKQIMGIFSFEDSKMEFAKYAYDFCVDKSNYYTLADAFTFSGSREDLLKFINLKK